MCHFSFIMSSRMNDITVCDAFRQNEHAKVKSWIAGGWKVNKLVNFSEEGKKGRIPPLCIAIKMKQTEIVRELLAGGANPSAGGWLEHEGYREWCCPFEEAVMPLQLEVVMMLIEAGAEVNQCIRGLYATEEEGGTIVFGDECQSFLHQAAMRWQPRVVRILVENGANVCAINSFGETPLRLACDYFSSESVVTLIQWGAPISNLAEDVTSPLDLLSSTDERTMNEIQAGVCRRERQRCIQLLYEAGYEITEDAWWQYIINQRLDKGIFQDADFTDWSLKVLRNPRTLQQLCRVSILKELREVGRCNPPSIASLTRLPNKLISYLCFSEYSPVPCASIP